MKLWHSFVKELILSSRSFYFYIEIGIAALLVFVMFFVVPENFDSRADEYLYHDIPEAAEPFMAELYLKSDEDGKVDTAEFKLDDQVVMADFYETEDSRIYVFDDKATMIRLADQDRTFGGVVHMDEQGEVTYTYYLQGYETERLRNIYSVLHNTDSDTLEATFNAQEVRTLEADQVSLTDRQYVLPSILTFNGSLMGLFMIAAYVFLDKKEGVIKAYAVTPSAVWQYLLSKAGVIAVTSTVTSLIIVAPIMGLSANYPLLLLLLLTSGFFASALGLVMTSYYTDFTQAFGAFYILIILLMLPNISYFVPSWAPAWITYFPTYPMLQGFKESLLANTDVAYVLMASLGFMVAGLVLFLFANFRFKKTLTV